MQEEETRNGKSQQRAMRPWMCPSPRTTKHEIAVVPITVTKSIAVMRLDEGVRKQKPKMSEFNNLHHEEDYDTFKRFRDERR